MTLAQIENRISQIWKELESIGFDENGNACDREAAYKLSIEKEKLVDLSYLITLEMAEARTKLSANKNTVQESTIWQTLSTKNKVILSFNFETVEAGTIQTIGGVTRQAVAKVYL